MILLNLLPMIADKFASVSPLLRDMLFVSLIRIYQDRRYLDSIENPLLRVEALIHLGEDAYPKLESSVLDRMLSWHPLGVLIYAGANYDNISRKQLTRITKLSLQRPELLSLAIAYTGSKDLYEDIFVGIAGDERNPRRILMVSMLLDSITFRYSIDYVLPFTEGLVKKFMRNDEIPDILRRMLASILLAQFYLLGGDIMYDKEYLVRGLRLSSDDVVFLQAAPIIAKNLYVVGDKEIFEDILVRLNELRRSMIKRSGPFGFIVPPSPSRLTRALRESAYILNSILMVLDVLSRSDRFIDNGFAMSYLESLFGELSDPTTLYVLTKFKLKTNQNNQQEIINSYMAKARGILSQEERKIMYRHLGLLFASKIATDVARRYILENLSKNSEILKHFILGLYEETLRQYPLIAITTR